MGAVLGWIAGLLAKSGDRIVIIENVLVGIFGAYIGGDFVAALLSHGATNDKDFSAGSLGLSVLGAIVMLLILKLLRKSVGPMKPAKGPRRRD
ncbi:MAG: GlsB/YeaQ/YmgE family stress response membrane protein [Pseudomonadota bacterium]